MPAYLCTFGQVQGGWDGKNHIGRNHNYLYQLHRLLPDQTQTGSLDWLCPSGLRRYGRSVSAGLCPKKPGLSFYRGREWDHRTVKRAPWLAGLYPALWDIHVLYLPIIMQNAAAFKESYLNPTKMRAVIWIILTALFCYCNIILQIKTRLYIPAFIHPDISIMSVRHILYSPINPETFPLSYEQ